jgi:nicotinamide-nucleotide amidase
VTGIAGPEGGSKEKPVGLAYVGICDQEEGKERVVVKKLLTNPNYARKDIKFWFSQMALYFLLKHLQNKLESDFPGIFPAVGTIL